MLLPPEKEKKSEGVAIAEHKSGAHTRIQTKEEAIHLSFLVAAVMTDTVYT